MNIVDRSFAALTEEIRRLDEKELYYRIRRSFDAVPPQTQKSCMDFFNQFPFWGHLDPDNGVYQQIEEKQLVLYHHLEDFVWLYETLADYRSKKTLYSILSNWYRYDFTSTSQTKECLFDEYFDLDVVRCSPEEVVVDLGAYTGDTALSYIRNYGEDCYKRIYCYEITPETFAQLQRNLAGCRDVECRCCGVADRVGYMSLAGHDSSPSANMLEDTQAGEIPVTTLDEDIREPVTLIKADTEGGEQRALRGAEGHIRREHPKLLISVYHSNEDLWKIPRMVRDYWEGYTLYLRYKSSPIYPTEITLLAV